MPLMGGVFPQRSRSQGRPSGAALAGLPLDAGESEGKRHLSADAVPFGLRVSLRLAWCGRSLDLVR